MILISIPKCLHCEDNQRFLGFMEGYNQYCSKKCASSYHIQKELKQGKLIP